MSLRVTYLGHATVWMESAGVSCLTDPIFSEKIFWLQRHSPLPPDLSPFSQPDAIFVSHAHYDHLDLPSYKYFSLKIPIVTPPGLKKLLRKFLRNPIIELEAGASFQVTPQIRATAFPVKHLGFRLLPFRYTRCNGYLIELGAKRIFFPGDTAYRDFRGDLKQTPINLALLPISCYKPEWFMKGRHTNPVEAVKIFEEIGAQQMVPIHWGTFKLSTEPMEEPIQWLQKIAAEKNLTERIKVLMPGEIGSFT